MPGELIPPRDSISGSGRYGSYPYGAYTSLYGFGGGLYGGYPYSSYPYGDSGSLLPYLDPGSYYAANAASYGPPGPPPPIPNQNYSEEKPPAADAIAHIEVKVPPEAEIWFGSAKTRQSGSVREFASPPLPPGQDYTYEIRARWQQDGRTVVQTRKVTVSAGSWEVVDFTKAPVEQIGEMPRP